MKDFNIVHSGKLRPALEATIDCYKLTNGPILSIAKGGANCEA